MRLHIPLGQCNVSFTLERNQFQGSHLSCLARIVVWTFRNENYELMQQTNSRVFSHVDNADRSTVQHVIIVVARSKYCTGIPIVVVEITNVHCELCRSHKRRDGNQIQTIRFTLICEENVCGIAIRY